MTWLTFVLVSLTAARVTRLITSDSLTTPLRHALVNHASQRKHAPWYVVLVHCDWCVSIWVAGAATLVAVGLGLSSWHAALFLWGGSAFLAGAVLAWLDRL